MTQGTEGEGAGASGSRSRRWLGVLLGVGMSVMPTGDAVAKPRRPSPLPAATRKPATTHPAIPELEAATAALQAGRPVEAHDRLRRWLAQGGDEAQLSPAQAAGLQAIRAAGLPAVGEVAVSGQPGTEVRIDDQPLAKLPLPLPILLPAGGHQVVLAGTGGLLQAQIQVRAGRRLDVRESREAGAVLLSQPPHALLGVRLSEPSIPLTEDQVRASTEQGLRGTQLYLTPRDSALQPRLSDCGERAACLRELAVSQDVEYLLLTQASPGTPPAGATTSPPPPASGTTGAGPAVVLRAVLFDAKVADQAAVAEDTCSTCSAAELAGRLRDLVAQVSSRGLGRPRGNLRIECEPVEAELQLNGAPLARGERERTLWSGEVAIVASLSGYRPQTLRHFVAEGSQETVRLHLEPLPPPPVVAPPVLAAATPPPAAPRIDRAPRPLWRIVTGATALVGGGLLLGFGAGAQSVNGRCVDAVEPPANQCNRLYQTSTLATSLLVTGGIAAVAGVVLLAVPGPVRPRHAARKGP